MTVPAINAEAGIDMISRLMNEEEVKTLEVGAAGVLAALLSAINRRTSEASSSYGKPVLEAILDAKRDVIAKVVSALPTDPGMLSRDERVGFEQAVKVMRYRIEKIGLDLLLPMPKPEPAPKPKGPSAEDLQRFRKSPWHLFANPYGVKEDGSFGTGPS